MVSTPGHEYEYEYEYEYEENLATFLLVLSAAVLVLVLLIGRTAGSRRRMVSTPKYEYEKTFCLPARATRDG